MAAQGASGMMGGGSDILSSWGSALIGGALSYWGQQSANQANKRLAQGQMEFQERMSNSAYQRAVVDMEKAGLNPMLAYDKGGASTPPGAMARMENPMSGVPAAVQSALAVRRQKLELDAIQSQVEKNKADAHLSEQKNLSEINYQIKTEQEAHNLHATKQILDQQLTNAKSSASGAILDQKINEGDMGELVRYLERLAPAMSAVGSVVGRFIPSRSFMTRLPPASK